MVVDVPIDPSLIFVLQHYRYWVLWRCAHVRFLDYKKVKDFERKKARELFGTEAEPTALASKVGGLHSTMLEN
jgi:U2 small nuclear ribonucleoprotein A'